MVACRRCRAPITLGQTEDGVEVELEAYSEPVGDYRYTIVAFDTEPWTVRPLDGSSPIDGYTDHKVRCPTR
jgi:hypothetical protein